MAPQSIEPDPIDLPAQDGHAHGERDKIGTYGNWVNIPGALDALITSKDLLTKFVTKQPFSSVESYLRESVYQMAPFATDSMAGGTVPEFAKQTTGIHTQVQHYLFNKRLIKKH